jgi:hypothetical protein
MLSSVDNDKDECKAPTHRQPTNMNDDITQVTPSLDRIHRLSMDMPCTHLCWANNTHTPTTIHSQSRTRTDANDTARQPSQRLTYWYRTESDKHLIGEHHKQASLNLGQPVHTCAPYDRGRETSQHHCLQPISHVTDRMLTPASRAYIQYQNYVMAAHHTPNHCRRCICIAHRLPALSAISRIQPPLVQWCTCHVRCQKQIANRIAQTLT